MKYDVWRSDGGGPSDAMVFDAYDAAAAAEGWADWEDAHSADYWIVGGTDARVCVREHGGEQVYEFVVVGSVERSYSARPVMAKGK